MVTFMDKATGVQHYLYITKVRMTNREEIKFSICISMTYLCKSNSIGGLPRLPL